MKKIITSFLLLIIFAFIFTSCRNVLYVEGEGEIVTKEEALNNDTSLIVDNIIVLNEDNTIKPLNVNIHLDSTKKIKITAQQSIIDYIKIDETLNTLTVFADSNVNFKTSDITIDIYGCKFTNIVSNLSIVTCDSFATNLNINLKKASKFVADNINVKSFNATLDYSCQMEINKANLSDFSLNMSNKAKTNIASINCQNLNIVANGASCLIEGSSVEVNSKYNLTGSSTVTVGGKTQAMDVTITGASSFYGKANISDNVTLIASGESYIEVYANKSLNIIDTGAKEIKNFGSGIVTKTNILVK